MLNRRKLKLKLSSTYNHFFSEHLSIINVYYYIINNNIILKNIYIFMIY